MANIGAMIKQFYDIMLLSTREKLEQVPKNLWPFIRFRKAQGIRKTAESIMHECTYIALLKTAATIRQRNHFDTTVE